MAKFIIGQGEIQKVTTVKAVVVPSVQQVIDSLLFLTEQAKRHAETLKYISRMTPADFKVAYAIEDETLLAKQSELYENHIAATQRSIERKEINRIAENNMVKFNAELTDSEKELLAKLTERSSQLGLEFMVQPRK